MSRFILGAVVGAATLGGVLALFGNRLKEKEKAVGAEPPAPSNEPPVDKPERIGTFFVLWEYDDDHADGYIPGFMKVNGARCLTTSATTAEGVAAMRRLGQDARIKKEEGEVVYCTSYPEILVHVPCAPVEGRNRAAAALYVNMSNLPNDTRIALAREVEEWAVACGRTVSAESLATLNNFIKPAAA